MHIQNEIVLGGLISKMDLVTGIWKLYRGCIDVEVAVNFTHITFWFQQFLCPSETPSPTWAFPMCPHKSGSIWEVSFLVLHRTWRNGDQTQSPPVPHKDRHHVWSEAPYDRCTWLDFFRWPSDQVLQKNIMISIDLWQKQWLPNPPNKFRETTSSTSSWDSMASKNHHPYRGKKARTQHLPSSHLQKTTGPTWNSFHHIPSQRPINQASNSGTPNCWKLHGFRKYLL